MFRAHLPPLAPLERRAAQQLHTVHCLAHAATIQLHAAFARQDATSRAKCLDAATAILRVGATAQVHNCAPYIEPALGVCYFIIISPVRLAYLCAVLQAIWVATSRVVISEIAGLRAFYLQTGDLHLAAGREAELDGVLEGIQGMLSGFASMSEYR
jgi:hypothetical protein